MTNQESMIKMLEDKTKMLMRSISSGGSRPWAEARCYAEKADSVEEAYLIGFLDACEKFIIMLGLDLDKVTKECYTTRKAQTK